MSTPVRVTPGSVDGVIEEIRVVMVRRKMTQHSLAQKLGEGDPWVHRRLTGRAEITVRELYRIAEALGVEARSLLPRGGSATGEYIRLRHGSYGGLRRPVRLSPPMADAA